MALPTNLRWFKDWEFQRPELVNAVAAVWLDELRNRFGKALILTDDARVLGEPLPPGASGRSWHYKGQAFDIRIKHFSQYDLWNLVQAVFIIAAMARAKNQGGIELELVWSRTDKHMHIAFKLDNSPDELIIRGE